MTVTYDAPVCRRRDVPDRHPIRWQRSGWTDRLALAVSLRAHTFTADDVFLLTLQDDAARKSLTVPERPVFGRVYAAAW